MQIEHAQQTVLRPPGLGNLVRRNGGLEIWQRGPSVGVVASAADYTADGWMIQCGALNAFTVSRQPGLVNQSQYSGKFQRNAGSTGVNSVWFIFPMDYDEIFPMLGKFVRLSFLMKTGANWSPTGLSAQLLVGTGAPVANGTFSFTTPTSPLLANLVPTAAVTLYSLVSTVIVPTSTRQAELRYGWSYSVATAAGADDSVTIDDVQLEVLSDRAQPASPFERLLFIEQLRLCQRHFYKTFDYDTVPAAGTLFDTGDLESTVAMPAAHAAAGQNMCYFRFPVPMRAPPAIATYNPEAAGGQVRNVSADVNHTLTTASFLTGESGRFTSTGNAAGVANHYCSVHFTADSGL